MSDTTYNFNDDGSIDLTIGEKPVRFVKESDLLAIKGGSETKVKEWETKESQFQTQIVEANRLRDESHSTLLQEQAASEQLKSQITNGEALKTRVGELETELVTHKEGSGKLETELVGLIRHNLINVYGASEDSLKDKNLEQLRNLDSAAQIIRPAGKAARYDGGPGGPGGGSVPETSIERARRIIEEHEAKKGRPVQVSSIAIKT